jgi:hypothetical protein
MLEKSRLEELSQELPEKERKTLLERIGRRMETEEGEEAVAVELQEDERDKIIAFEMKRASPWIRFMVWLRTFVTGRSRKDVFLDVRLRMIKTHLRNVSPGLTGFESRDLTAKFARKLYDVYLKTLTIGGVYHAFFADKAVRGAAYTWYLEERLEEPKRGIDDFVGTEEMEEIFSQTGQTEEIRKKLALRLNEYVKAVPESRMLKLEEEAKLHLFLGKLCAFPFAAFFRYFNCLLGDPPDPHYPTFESAPVMLTLDLMEKLHVALSLVKRCAPDYLFPEEPISFYLAVRGGITPGDKRESDKRSAELARLRSDVMELAHEIDAFETAVPLLDLLRYFRHDPWYQLMFNAPRLYLRNLAFSTLKARLAVQLEERLGTIKERVIGRKMEELLKGQKLIDFVYYRDAPEFDFRKLSLPYFASIRSLTLVYNFLLQQFKGAMQEAAQLVSATALTNNRIIQTRLTQNISGLEDLEARVVLFDRTLSPDEEDGKQLARFRFNVGTDMLLQKSYRAFIQQKDREARDLIEKAREFLSGVRTIFDEIRTSTFENTRSLLKTIHLYRGRNQTLGQILNTRSETIGSFLKLLDQLLELEKGD